MTLRPVAILATLLLVGCGDAAPEDSTPAPCNGECPALQCIAGRCLLGGDTGNADTDDEADASDAGDAMIGDAVEQVDTPEPDVPEGCAADSRCARGAICDETLDPPACREGCRDDLGCDTDSYCVDETLTCVEGCRDDASCEGDLVCDLGTRTCQAASCNRDADCAEGLFCQGRQCAPGCRTGGCGEGQYCEPVGRACVDGCADNEGCPEDSWCRDHVCEVGCRDDGDCLEGEECEELDEEDGGIRVCLAETCRRDRDCEEGFYCGEAEFGRDICLEGCRVDGEDCGLTLVCDGETRTCQAPTCDGDDACGLDEICLESSCRFGCREDAGCAQGQLCEPAENACTCFSDEDCPEAALCDRGLCAQRCGSDADCGAPTTCDPELGVCAEGCRDDLYEPNDEFFDATPVEPGTLEDLRICYDEGPLAEAQDCFEFMLEEGAPARVDLAFDVERGDLDLAVYDPEFTVAASAVGPEATTVEFQASQFGTYRACVIATGDQPLRVLYSLDFQF